LGGSGHNSGARPFSHPADDNAQNAIAEPVRILIVDDHALFREGLAEILDKSPELTVIGRCGTSAEALELLATQPGVVLLDFDLGGELALNFLEKARNQGFKGRILIVTAGVSEPEALQLVRAGVAGILHKHNTPELLRDKIRQVAAGEVCLEERYLKPLFRSVDQTAPPRTVRLTDRDQVILRLVFQGLGNKEIGARLSISEGAVKASLRLLFQKLGVHTRSQMVKVALEEYRDQL
jgi:two-component system, NarL family, nitrate/nitrite response regulator NarL